MSGPETDFTTFTSELYASMIENNRNTKFTYKFIKRYIPQNIL